jgi:hypothetical protein
MKVTSKLPMRSQNLFVAAVHIALLAVVTLTGERAVADDFVPLDEIISPQGVPLADPEFDEVAKRVTWQLGPTSELPGILFVADVDPHTGAILDPLTGVGLTDGGSPLRIDEDLVPRSFTTNGPEWTLGVDGGQIVYTKFNTAGEMCVARARFDGLEWSSNILVLGSNRFTPKGSRFPSDTVPQVAYFGFVDGPQGVEARLASRNIDQPLSEIITPVRTGGGNYLPGERAFLTTAAPTGGRPQVHVFDTDTGAFEQVTFDGGRKLQSPELWFAPDFEDRMLFVVNSRLATSGEARVFSRVSEDDNFTWERELSIESPSPDKPFIKSPRPFVFEGKSYIVFLVQPEPVTSTSAEVWISDLNPEPEQRFMRRVSAADPADQDIRFDPETFVTTNGPIIYYSHVRDGLVVLRRAQTGLTTSQ